MNTQVGRVARPGEPPLSLGSWHIFSRLSFDEGAELVQGAIDRGIRQFDIGDYWDHELLNTERFRDIAQHLGLARDDYRLSVKLFTNSTRAREDVLAEEMARLGVEQVDYAICSRPSPGEDIETAVRAMAKLVEMGLTKSLAVSLWEGGPLREAIRTARELGVAEPKFVQYQYNVARRTVVEADEMQAVFAETGIGLQPSFTMEGGLLAGHLQRRRYNESDRQKGDWMAADDRNLTRDAGEVRQAICDAQPRLVAKAVEFGVKPAQLALAFAATHPALDTLLFGATRVWQLDEALEALDLARDKPEEVRAAVAEFRISAAKAPPLFDPTANLH